MPLMLKISMLKAFAVAKTPPWAWQVSCVGGSMSSFWVSKVFVLVYKSYFEVKEKIYSLSNETSTRSIVS